MRDGGGISEKEKRMIVESIGQTFPELVLFHIPFCCSANILVEELHGARNYVKLY